MRSSTPWPAAILSSVLAIGILSGPATAQFQQYTPPGDLQDAATSRREGIESDVKNARWHLGAMRIQPELSLRNLAFVDDVFVGSGEADVSDVTASVAAGLHFYLPAGSKTTIAAYVLPSYVWWQDQKDRRRINESYGVGIFAYFNRLSLELTGSSDESLSFATSEIEQQVTDRRDVVTADVEILFRRNLAFFVGASSSELRFLVDDAEREDPRIAPFDLLDRDEDILRAGLRAKLRGGWSVDLGFERSEAAFRNSRNNLSNSGTSPTLGVRLQSEPWQIIANAALRSLEADGDSNFQEFDEATGRIEIALKARSRLTLRATAGRNLTYSISEGFTFALDDRVGLAAEWALGRRTQLLLAAETGEVDYTVGASIAPRLDDYDGWRVQIKWGLGRKADLKLGITDTQYDSNLPGFDRSVTQITSGISFGESSWP